MKTLEELKAENAAAEKEASETPQVEEEEIETKAEEEETDESKENAELEGNAESSESEAWMQSDEQTSQEDNAEKSFTGSDIAAAKNKLRTKLEKRHNNEVEELRAEIEKLKSHKTASPLDNGAQIPPKPKLDDFDFDEDAYQLALDKWDDARLEAKIKKATTGHQENAQQQQAIEAFNSAVDQHYERAAKLAADAGITAEVYQQSDLAVRSAIEQAMPSKGDLVTEQLIATLGDGSEKVMYYLGRNKTELNGLQSALLEDPSGMKAMLLLGRISSKISNPTKKTSQAPKPATQLKGDEGSSLSAEAKALKKAYQEADKSGNAQARFDARRKARQAGIDVSTWQE